MIPIDLISDLLITVIVFGGECSLELTLAKMSRLWKGFYYAPFADIAHVFMRSNILTTHIFAEISFHHRKKDMNN